MDGSTYHKKWFDLFDHVIADDLDLECGHKVLIKKFTGVRNSIHIQSLDYFASFFFPCAPFLFSSSGKYVHFDQTSDVTGYPELAKFIFHFQNFKVCLNLNTNRSGRFGDQRTGH